MNEPEAFVGIHEAAEILDYHPEHIRKLCREGKLPFHQSRPRADYRFLTSELRAWIRGEWEPTQ